MITSLCLALAVVAQAGFDDDPSLPTTPDDRPAPASTAAAEPGLHRLRIVEPRDCWVWSVRLPGGKFRPVEYRPSAAAPRPAFETNGVVAERLAGDQRVIRASDPGTMAEARQQIEAAKKRPEGPSCPTSDELARLRDALALAAFWDQVRLYLFACLVLAAAVFSAGLALRLRRPHPHP